MSGGKFDYNQYRINEIADEIENIVKNNNKKDEWGQADNYPEDIIKEFKNGIEILRKASIYAQRIDWFLSGDDGENSFRERLKEDLKELENKGSAV